MKLTKWRLDYIIWGVSMGALMIMMDRYPFPEVDGKKVDDESGALALLGGDMEFI